MCLALISLLLRQLVNSTVISCHKLIPQSGPGALRRVLDDLNGCSCIQSYSLLISMHKCNQCLLRDSRIFIKPHDSDCGSAQ